MPAPQPDPTAPLADLIPSGNPRLDAQLAFSAVIDRMTAILRRTRLLDQSRQENDAEHSWHIAVMALLFREHATVNPNLPHAVEMLLVHDLVEIYAGDTFAYDDAGYQDKLQREQQAADRLYALLPPDQGRHLRDLWQEFDAMETDDAKYANCLDRIQPFLHNTLTQGYTWRLGGDRPVTRSQVRRRMAIVRPIMPAVHDWIETCLDTAVRKGWVVADD